MSDNNKYSNEIRIPLTPIQEDEIDSNSIGGVQIKNGAITARHIRANSINTDHLTAGCVTAEKLHSDVITAFQVKVLDEFKGSTVVFSASGATLSWTAGVIYLRGTKRNDEGEIEEVQITQNVSAGSHTFSAQDASPRYFYITWEVDDKGKPVENATLSIKQTMDYPTGTHDVALCYAYYDTTLQMVRFNMVGRSGGTLISGGMIQTGSIFANLIKGDVIRANTIALGDRFISSTVTFTATGQVVSSTGGTIKLKKTNYGDTLADTTVGEATITVNAFNQTIYSNGWLYILWTGNSYGEPTDQTVSVQFSSSYPTGNVVVLAYVWLDGSKAQVRNVYSGGVIISGGSIQAGSITSNHIQAGAISTSHLSFTPLISAEGTNSIIATINASTEGLRISGSKIMIDGTVQFSAGYDPSTKVPIGGSADDVNTHTTTISGDKIRTGTIISNNNASWINLNDGTFSFGNGKLSWNGSTLTVQGNIVSSTVSSSTITGSEFVTNTVADTYIKINGDGSFIPQIRFYYENNLQHYIQEALGSLYISNVHGGDIYITATSPYTVYIQSSLNISNALIAGSATAGYHVLFGDTTITGTLTVQEGIYFTNSDNKLNASDGVLRFYNGSKTIYFRYYDGKIQGKTDDSTWYDLW